jgi:hypothetical protein
VTLLHCLSIATVAKIPVVALSPTAYAAPQNKYPYQKLENITTQCAWIGEAWHTFPPFVVSTPQHDFNRRIHMLSISSTTCVTASNFTLATCKGVTWVIVALSDDICKQGGSQCVLDNYSPSESFRFE